MDQMGTVKSWFDDKGWGFVVQAGCAEDIFVHYTAIRMDGRRSLVPGKAVRFQAQRRERGLVASWVEPVVEAEAERCQACGQELPQ